MSVFQQVLFFCFLGFMLCQSIDNIPFLSTNSSINDPAFDVIDYIKEKCAQRGQTNIVEEMQTETRKSVVCIRKFVNVSLVQDDLRKDLKANDMDGFFEKYCGVWPQLHSCFQNTIDLIKNCLNETEKQQVDESLEVLDSVQTFMCADSANQMINFYKRGGIENFQDNWVGIKKCITSRGHKTIIFDSDRCEYVEWFRVCTNEGMNRSNGTGPIETMNEMFVTIKKQYCPSSASSKFSDSFPLIGLIILSLLRFTNIMESYLLIA